jgi:hypothetical protein
MNKIYMIFISPDSPDSPDSPVDPVKKWKFLYYPDMTE